MKERTTKRHISLNEALDKLPSGDLKERSVAFEKMVKFYLENDSVQRREFMHVYLWREWVQRNNLSGVAARDTGVDLVAMRGDDEKDGVVAIQAKLYKEDGHISKKDMSNFVSKAGERQFTEMMFATTSNVELNEVVNEIYSKQTKRALIVCRRDLDDTDVDWGVFLGLWGGRGFVKEKRKLKEHQRKAVKQVSQSLSLAKRGKMIMACGTGKTFTSLRIAEKMVGKNGSVLFLVPSLSLLSQTLHEWSRYSDRHLNMSAVCSDAKAGREDEDTLVHELAFRASTKPEALGKSFAAQRCVIKNNKGEIKKNPLNVVFATYNSLNVVSKAQHRGLIPNFDLTICDEAHRTSGYQKYSQKDDLLKGSFYYDIHDDDYLKSHMRLYMTATPKIYYRDSDESLENKSPEMYSMDDEKIFGKTLFSLSFGQAVKKDLLSDYKVLILTVNKDAIQSGWEAGLNEKELVSTLDTQDRAKLIGCWNGLSKKCVTSDSDLIDKTPMKRVVAFANTIASSESMVEEFSNVIDVYTRILDDSPGDRLLKCELKHIDGKMGAAIRSNKLSWLNNDTDFSNEEPCCKILSNVRCLSEGVDVPALDGVIFLHPRKSQIDVVQSVGRVMRKAESKDIGYVILPVVIPFSEKPEEYLENNPSDFKVIWQVLKALRSHDEDLDTKINALDVEKSELKKKVSIFTVGEPKGKSDGVDVKSVIKEQMPLFSEKLKDAIVATIVRKCGRKQYWDGWAGSVASIAKTSMDRIYHMLDSGNMDINGKFIKFLDGLRKNLNPSIDKDDAVKMLAQHLITKPVFDALFTGDVFVNNNPVSRSMESMLNVLNKRGFQSETKDLEPFYEDVKSRISEIKSSSERQSVMSELYKKFFYTSFKEDTEKFGIVYTPVEIVDFILKSADLALENEFGRNLTDENVHIIDPFTGTGTFITRLIRSDNALIDTPDLTRKYMSELHANEITLLAYYIASVNIESIYHDRLETDQYHPFNGIVLTDTYQQKDSFSNGVFDGFFDENSDRVKKQLQKPIQVIVGNPPYSAGQKDGNDNNQNQRYPKLEKDIRETYGNKGSSFDYFVLALRWASNRIKEDGIVAFVINGSFIDGKSSVGLRKCLLDDFSSVYCFDLRGNISKHDPKEGENVFGQACGRHIAIIVLIKNKRAKHKGRLFYYDIGDSLKEKEKLSIIEEFKHYQSIPWVNVVPNNYGDWINQREDMNKYDSFLQIGGAKSGNSIFIDRSLGVNTARDAWVYGFSKKSVENQMRETIDFYNSQVGIRQVDFNNPKKIKWSNVLLTNQQKGLKHEFCADAVRVAMFRPFCKQYLYLDRFFVHSVGGLRFFSNPQDENLAIFLQGNSSHDDFSAIMVNMIPDLSLIDKGKCYPLYAYSRSGNNSLLSNGDDRDFNISDEMLKQFQCKYKGAIISKEDIFFYVYGVLHSLDFKTKYAIHLNKDEARIPFAKSSADFTHFVDSGRKLANLHLNYEYVEEYPVKVDVKSETTDCPYCVEKQRMSFGKHQGLVDKTVIRFNKYITISNIPLEAYEYRVKGKSAIESFRDAYCVKTDSKTGIKKDPNEWSDDPKYILSLLKRVITVSVESMKIVRALPNLDI